MSATNRLCRLCQARGIEEKLYLPLFHRNNVTQR